MATEVTAPGVYDGMPAETYHGDPVPAGSLSSGGVKRLLPPSCPAKYRYWADNPAEHKAEFDFGHAAHKLVLGVGPELVEIAGTGSDENAWRTNDDKAAVEAAHAAGQIPLKPRDMATVVAMAAAIRAHPVASRLFQPGQGAAEQSAFWVDERFGLWRRARFDWVPHWMTESGRLLIPDYKTTRAADEESLRRELVRLGYDMTAAWYEDAARSVGLAKDVCYLFVFQEKEPPYVVSVMQPDVVAVKRGELRNRLAMSIYAECVESGVWPGFVDGVGLLPLPDWVESEFDREQEQGMYDVKGAAK